MSAPITCSDASSSYFPIFWSFCSTLSFSAAASLRLRSREPVGPLLFMESRHYSIPTNRRVHRRDRIGRPRAAIDALPGPAQGSSWSDRCIPSNRRDAARDPMNHPVRSTRRSSGPSIDQGCLSIDATVLGPYRYVAAIDATVLGSRLSIFTLPSHRRDGPRVPIDTLPRSTRRSSGPRVHCLDRRDGLGSRSIVALTDGPRVRIGTLPRSTRRSSGPDRYVRPTDASGLPDLRSRQPDRRIGTKRRARADRCDSPRFVPCPPHRSLVRAGAGEGADGGRDGVGHCRADGVSLAHACTPTEPELCFNATDDFDVTSLLNSFRASRSYPLHLPDLPDRIRRGGRTRRSAR